MLRSIFARHSSNEKNLILIQSRASCWNSNTVLHVYHTVCIVINEYQISPKYTDSQVRANSVDPDQMPQNVASDQGLHCLLCIQQFSVKLTCWKFLTSIIRT